MYVLVDFDNHFIQPIESYTPLKFEFQIKQIIELVVKFNENPAEIRIKFYGGWYKGDLLTAKASELLKLISAIKVFPFIKDKNLIKGTIQLASAMHYYPSYVWTHTFKEKDGIAKMQIKTDGLSEWCENNQSVCPIHLVQKFTKKKDKICHHEHCTTTNAKAFINFEQKMVDTLLTCDLISITEDEETSGICLFTDDFDFLPSLAYCSISKLKRKKNLPIQLFIKNNRQEDLISQILSPFEIQILVYDEK